MTESEKSRLVHLIISLSKKIKPLLVAVKELVSCVCNNELITVS